MAQFSKVKLTNSSNGPKGVHSKAGIVVIEAGDSLEVEISDGELASAKATGWFKGGSAKSEDNPERDELKKQAEELGLEYPKNISNEKLKEIIDAKLAEGSQ